MIRDDTELLFIDEWTKKMTSADEAKTLLQGGIFAQSVKHLTPRMANMNAAVLITCNHVPNFGEEQASVERRLAIYHRPVG